MKRATFEVQLSQHTLQELLTVCAATGFKNDSCLKVLKKTKGYVTVQLSLPRLVLRDLFRLAALRKMTIADYLQELLAEVALPALEELERIESTGKIVRFPVQ